MYFLRSIISETLTILERFKISETYLKWIKESGKMTRVPIKNLYGLLFSLLLLIIKGYFMTFWLLKVMFIKSCAHSLCFTYYGTEEVCK